MRKLLALIIALFLGQARAEDTKLGGNDDPIRQMLFASQTLKEQVERMHTDGSPGVFQSIANAHKLTKEGKKTEAIDLLHGLLENPDIETRVRLWIWSGLRELGESPSPEKAFEVLGAIIEMPSGDGVDTLAAYVDGTARYLNFSGRAIFWDQENKEIKDLCQALIDSTIPDSSKAKPRVSLDLPKRNPQVTLLTRSGTFVITSPSNAVSSSGATLMIELMKHVEEDQG